MNDLFSLPDFDPVRSSDAVRPGPTPLQTTTAGPDPAVRRAPEGLPRKADQQGYFNTTRLSGRELAAAQKDARTQQDRIRRLFETMPDDWLAAPSKVHQLVGGKAPITSIRRAMTDLTDQGVLTRTDAQKTGPHGKPEFLWRRAISVRRAA